MKLKKELLLTDELEYEYGDNFEDCLNAHGLYSATRFVVRLSPVNHEYIDKINEGNFVDLSPEAVQAYSTYLHETIHWWQHIGSTIGLIMSLSYPAQTHRNVEHLRALLNIIGPKKSIHIYNLNNATEITPSTDQFNHINIILNNYFDIEYFKSLVIRPTSAPSISKSPYFESVGHSYNIGYASSIFTLAEVFDREFNFFPNPDKWIPGFEDLKNKKQEGYYYGSKINLPPLGLKEIFEGQARFCQMQYLFFGSGESLSWEDFAQLGYLDGIYFKAFNLFLEITETKIPKNLADPTVGLFLLICDIAINPGEGFPFDLKDHKSFIISIDPGFRFYLLCHEVKKNPSLKETIKDYSKEEYDDVSKSLCKEIVTYAPTEVNGKILNWINNSDNLKGLLKEEKEFNYQNENHPIRVILSKYLRFCEAKYKNPEFYCWPGAWMAGEKAKDLNEKLFLNHLSLFMDKKGDKGIYPREFPNIPHENIHKTLNNFYTWNIMYDLTQQWIIKGGPFNYDYSWLTQKQKESDLKKWADDIFAKIYGERPDKFEILIAKK